MLCAFNLWTQAQTSTRAIHVNLDPKRASVYDSLFHANDWRKEYVKNAGAWLKENNVTLEADWINKTLKVGDKMPDLELGTVINNTGKQRFSDLKGKIVILDFWATTCKTCIASFPKMKALQEKFGDKIQIILVNVSETQDVIEKRMGKNIRKVPNLLSIVGAKHLIQYFPSKSVPYHVWIDQNGTIQILGSCLNTYEGKINDLLNQKKIFNYPTESTRPGFSPDVPYYSIVRQPINSAVYNSFFTSFNSQYQPSGTGVARNKKDFLNHTIRNTFVNCTIQELYLSPVFKRLFDVSRNEIKGFTPIVYEVQDSLRYDVMTDNVPQIDTVRSKMMFCYEQIYPKGLSEEQSQEMMLQDLNSYFGKMYGTYGRIEKRSLPGFVIQKQSGEKYKKMLSNSKENKETVFVKNKKKWVRYQCISFLELFPSSIVDWLYANNKVLVNESGISGDAKIDIELPVNAVFSDVAQALKPYGLNIKERHTELNQLVISDTKAK